MREQANYRRDTGNIIKIKVDTNVISERISPSLFRELGLRLATEQPSFVFYICLKLRCRLRDKNT